MKWTAITLVTIFLATVLVDKAEAQYSFWTPEGESFAIEISLENTDLKRLPMYRNAVQSLIVRGDHIVVGTAAEEGLAPFVYTASIRDREMVSYLDLEEIVPGQRSIQSDFCRGENGELYAGTIPNKEEHGGTESGHLIRVTVDDNGSLEILDLGIPVAGEGVFSVACNSEGTTVFGISYPNGNFFAHDLASGETETYDELVPNEEQMEVFRNYTQTPDMYLGRALMEDEHGRIYGSTGLNEIFYFDPQEETFTILEETLPEVWGRTSLGQVQSWARHADGRLFGGNMGDGQLFTLNPENGQVKNLGKPVFMHQMRGLTFADDGKLYGVAGGPPGYGHLFSYDEDGDGFRVYGNPQFTMSAPGIEQGIAWRGFNLSRIASSEDGSYVVIGEDEALSQLLIFAVE